MKKLKSSTRFIWVKLPDNLLIINKYIINTIKISKLFGNNLCYNT